MLTFHVTAAVVVIVIAVICSTFMYESMAICDSNVHEWTRERRCDQMDPSCPDEVYASKCGACEGIGGIALSDDPSDIHITECKVLKTAEEMQSSIFSRFTIARPSFPKVFTNTGFYEVQIFVHHDPFCLAQIPSTVSDGTHCFKKQQGTYMSDSNNGKLLIQYQDAMTTIQGLNMTEYFYHSKTRVHPHIRRYGVPLSSQSPICPCIDVGVGPVSHNWADDAEYLGREELMVEFLWKKFTVDHFIKGPHHVWVDVASKRIIRLWQPFNGLEIFDPEKYDEHSIDPSVLELPEPCKLLDKVCIDGTQPSSKRWLTNYYTSGNVKRTLDDAIQKFFHPKNDDVNDVDDDGTTTNGIRGRESLW